MKIRSLENVPIEDIHRAFTRAFSDYVEPFNLTVKQLQHTLQRCGYRDYLSFAALSEGEIVGFTLNGSGQWNGKSTAYDTGTGVQKSHRKQGIASQIFEVSLPVLKAHGISQYLLEVIKANTKAVDLYRKFGFLITREFDYWACPGDALRVQSGPLPEGITIRPLEDPDWSLLCRFWDFQPSWQNSVDSITRVRSSISILGAFHNDVPVAYFCMEEATGDIPQMAVRPEFRHQGLAVALLEQITHLLNPPEIRFTNTCLDSQPTRNFLLNLGLEPGHGQYEMILEF